MTNALEIYDPGRYEVMKLVAGSMAASGYFQDAKQHAQAIVKVLAGAELGVGPFASITGIHIIQGRPALSANLIAALIKNDQRYDYRVKVMTDDEVSIEFYEGGESIGLSTFTAQDAQRAGTKNMGKYPRNMLFARAMSNGAKWYTPGIFGGSPVYTPEELGADVDEDGNVIDGETESLNVTPGAGTVAEIQDAALFDDNGEAPTEAPWTEPIAASQDAEPPEPKETNGNGHDLTPPDPEAIEAFLNSLPIRNATAMTIASKIAAIVPYYDNAHHALNCTDHEAGDRLDGEQQKEMVTGLLERADRKAEEA